MKCLWAAKWETPVCLYRENKERLRAADSDDTLATGPPAILGLTRAESDLSGQFRLRRLNEL